MDEVQRIIFQVENEQKLRDYNALLVKQKETVEALVSLQKQGALSPAQAVSLTRAAEGAIESNREIAKASAALRGAMGPQGMTQLGYALEDFFAVQGGMSQRIGAISNNLQMVAASLGVGGKLFVGITGAIVGIRLFVNNVDNIKNWIMGLDAEKIASAEKEIKEAVSKWKGTVGQGNFGDRAQAGDVGKILGTNPEAINKGLLDVIGALPGGLPLNADQMKRKADLKGERDFLRNFPAFIPGVGARMQGLKAEEDKLDAAIRNEQASQIATDAMKPGAAGQAARETLRGFAQRFPGAFPSGFLEELNRAIDGGPADPNIGPPIEGAGMDPNSLRAAPPVMKGLRGFAGRLPTEQEQWPERQRREIQMDRRKRAREGDASVAPTAVPFDQEISKLEGLLDSARANGRGSPAWFRKTEARLQVLYRRMNAVLLHQSRLQGSSAMMGDYSASPLANWPQ